MCCNGDGGLGTAASGRTTTAATGTSSPRWGGSTTTSTGHTSLAAPVEAIRPSPSSSSSAARMSGCCLAVPLRSPHRCRLLCPHRRRQHQLHRQLPCLLPSQRPPRPQCPHRCRLLCPRLHLRASSPMPWLAIWTSMRNSRTYQLSNIPACRRGRAHVQVLDGCGYLQCTIRLTRKWWE